MPPKKERWEKWFRPIDSWRRLVAAVLICLGLTLCMFAPRLWLMRTYLPGTLQWDRAHTYLLQCEQPFRRDIETAMLWRLLPPLVSKGIGLRGHAPLVLPFVGVLVLTSYAAILLRRRSTDARFIFGGTLLLTTTSAVLVPLHWFGMNDAWVWLALLAIAFGEARWTLPLACLLAPWIDERFIIGLPLALLVRGADRQKSSPFRSWSVPAFWLLPYAGLRLGFTDHAVAHTTQRFLDYAVWQTGKVLSWAPLGWWMGLRVAWLPVLFAVRSGRWLLVGVAGSTAALSLVLASDISRSIALLIPLAWLGILDFQRTRPDLAPRVVLTLGVANLMIPAGHVVFTHLDVIHPLPIELVRLWRWL